jgi:hypothetical protein
MMRGSKILARSAAGGPSTDDTAARTSVPSASRPENAFAGDDYETAVFYPEDDRYLVVRDETSSHWEVAAHLEREA